MRVCVIEVFETITRDSGAQLEGGEGGGISWSFCKVENSPDYRKNAWLYSSID